jgi:hypothetical protein
VSAIALWPVGITLTSWHYMWRTTVLHRREQPGSWERDAPPPLPDGALGRGLQRVEDGVGPLFHRRYRARIRGSALGPEELVASILEDPNRCAPTELARFRRTDDGRRPLRSGDELLVHMPGPWNGPVRVVETTPTSFRLATLPRHLEAGQIAFRAADAGGRAAFEIESWARSGDRVSNLLYAHLRMAKEIQLHMWTSFLERVVELSRGRLDGGIDLDTRVVDWGRHAA